MTCIWCRACRRWYRWRSAWKNTGPLR